MKRKSVALLLGLVFAATPALVRADSVPLWPSEQQLTMRLAAVQAQLTALSHNDTLACAIATSKTSVRVGEPFALAWASVGASTSESGLPLRGASTIAISEAGTYRYALTFSDAANRSTDCTATIVVAPVK